MRIMYTIDLGIITLSRTLVLIIILLARRKCLKSISNQIKSAFIRLTIHIQYNNQLLPFKPAIMIQIHIGSIKQNQSVGYQFF